METMETMEAAGKKEFTRIVYKEEAFLQRFFSYRGRLNRKQYFWRVLATGIAGVLFTQVFQDGTLLTALGLCVGDGGLGVQLDAGDSSVS